MQPQEALAKGQARSLTSRDDWLVICRTDHPAFWGDEWYYAIAASDKRRWTPGEWLVERFRDGAPVDGARGGHA